ncbi:MAG: CHAD domain-containing protein, partial [Thermoanaerobaculia bacterium]
IRSAPMASEKRPGPAALPAEGDPRRREGAKSDWAHPGPPGGRKLRLPRRRPLREGILTAFARILAAARRAARSARQDPVAAVHEYRKSLRRARAVVSLLRASLGKEAAAGLARQLRGAFAVTGSFRDADILLATLRRLPPVPEDDPARHAIEAALELEQRRTRGETSETLAQALRLLAALPAVLDVTLDPEFSAHDLERGLFRSRRRERQALERARESGSDEDLHEWRKRVKELRYQVELLASTGSRELKKREKALGQLAQELGDVTDAIVLAREIARRQREGSVPPAPALLERIRELAADGSRRLRERGAGLFEGDPKLFARQVIAERG